MHPTRVVRSRREVLASPHAHTTLASLSERRQTTRRLHKSERSLCFPRLALRSSQSTSAVPFLITVLVKQLVCLGFESTPRRPKRTGEKLALEHASRVPPTALFLLTCSSLHACTGVHCPTRTLSLEDVWLCLPLGHSCWTPCPREWPKRNRSLRAERVRVSRTPVPHGPRPTLSSAWARTSC